MPLFCSNCITLINISFPELQDTNAINGEVTSGWWSSFVSSLPMAPGCQTPIAFPFTQHTMLSPRVNPGRIWLSAYKRLSRRRVKNNDPIVFNFLQVIQLLLRSKHKLLWIVRRRARELKAGKYRYLNYYPDSYYMQLARKEIRQNSTVIFRPVDRRILCKRCIGIPGDTVTIKAGFYMLTKNCSWQCTQQTTYVVGTRGTTINPRHLSGLT